MHSDWDSSDEDYVEAQQEFDINAFHIWDPLQQPVTLQYTTDQLHSARRSLNAAIKRI